MNIQLTSSTVVTSTTTSNQVANASSNSASTGSKASAYLQTLHEKFPSINFGSGTTSGDDRYSIAISPKFLEKMAANPQLAAGYEQFFADMPAAEDNFRNKVRAFGAEVVSSGVNIDEDGNITSWAVTRRSSDGSDSAKKADKERQKTIEEQQAARRTAAKKHLQENLSGGQSKPTYELNEYAGLFGELRSQRSLQSSFSAQA